MCYLNDAFLGCLGGVVYLQKIVPVLMFTSFCILAARKMLARRRLSRNPLPQDAVIIDVRSPGEFASGHHVRSRNIPLDVFHDGIAKLEPSRAIAVCCASGFRSAQAAKILKSRGFTRVIDVGSWRNIA